MISTRDGRPGVACSDRREKLPPPEPRISKPGSTEAEGLVSEDHTAKRANMHRDEVSRQIATCCRRMWEAGLIAGADGNVSVRVGPDRILVTPRGLLKCELEPEDIVEVDLHGVHRGGCRQATTELDLHLRVYRLRRECGAVVHAHPPTATAFAVAGEAIAGDVLPEITLLMGEVPVVPYATTGTPALGDATEPFIPGHDAVLLANHGALTWGADLAKARIRMESLEHAARILLAARTLGRVTRLTREQIDALERLRGTSPHDQY
ncbi:MAG: class II aldolase/adducin family protein [Gemmatimonadales bacterium]|nr:class II aldolase/adducin family protein [Gemmatimonadales bacterium]